MSDELQARRFWPDIVRTIAILLMIFFHTSYDLTVLGFLKINMGTDFWYWLPRFIVFLFLIVSGSSLVYSSQKNRSFTYWWKRLFKIGASMLLVSVATYLTFPDSWVYFGTLHCIFFCNLFGIFLLQKKTLRRFILVAIPLSWWLFNLTWDQLSFVPIVSMDYIPIYPWMAIFLVGMEIGQMTLNWPERELLWFKHFSWPSRHSLSIYLLHQPIIFGLLWCFS